MVVMSLCLSIVVAPRACLLRPHFREVAVPVGGCYTAIHQDVTARDEAAVWSHEQSADGTNFVGSAGALGDRSFDHAPVPGATRPREFVLGEWGHDNPRADRIDSRATLAPAHCFGHHAQ